MAISTPAEEIDQRITKLQVQLQQHSIAGALIIQRADLFYFSGTAQNAHLFVPAKGSSILIVKRSLARAREESSLKQIIPYEGMKQLAALVSDLTPRGSTIGLETDVLPANLYFRYQKLLEDYRLTDISKIIRLIRAIKSDYEVNLMKKAAIVGKEVFTYALQIIKPGIREIELAGELELKARKLGHQGAVRMRGFNQELYFGHVMSGENASASSFFDGPTGGSGLNPTYPQGAGQNVINKNKPILVDFVTVLDGYMVDQTRIFSLGKPAPQLQNTYNLAVDIKHTLADLGKPGVSGSNLYQKAEDMVKKAGLEKHFMGCPDKVSFVGHGVGLELDELPVIARGLDMPLEKGMVFALEPKFIFPGEGAVGIEDTFVVGSDCLEQITVFDDQLQII
jgi:Xaa-Pro dipeptidase